MERKAIVVCCVVGFLGLLSAATGFAAEATRVKLRVEWLNTMQEDQVQYPSTTECIYPTSPAANLGLTAAVSVMIAQIIINVATGCICCRKASQYESNRTVALICFVVSWFTCVIAFLLLLTAAAINDQHGYESLYLSSYYCYVVKPGVFAGASLLSLASVSLGLIYYLNMSSEKNRNDMWVPQGSIALGQPQFPPRQNHPPPGQEGPVFVHEDTYMRRQFA